MDIQDAIREIKKGNLVRRASWEGDRGLSFPIPHHKKHLSLNDDGIGIYCNYSFTPYTSRFPVSFTEEEILAEDWEFLKGSCSCFGCAPQHHSPVERGDLIEYWPCEGLRVIWAVTELTDYGAYGGSVYRIFDSEEEVDFTVKNDKVNLIRGDSLTVDRVKRGYINIDNVYPGMLHSGNAFNVHCKMSGERLSQLRVYETQKRIYEINNG